MKLKSILCVISSMALFSCNSGGGSSGPALSTEDQLKGANVTDYSQIIRPPAFTVVKANLSYEEVDQFKKARCANPNGASPVIMDSQLAVGQKFRKEFGYAESRGESSSMLTEDTITSVDLNAKKYIFTTNYEKIQTSIFPGADVNAIFSQRPHLTNSIEVTTDANGNTTADQKNISMNLTPKAQELIANNSSSTSMSCSVDYQEQNPNNTTTYSIVQMNFNNKVIEALVRNSTRIGNVICEERIDNQSTKTKYNLGLGQTTHSDVETFDIVLNSSNYGCSGHSIYYASTTTLENGNVNSSFAQKILSAPVK